MTCHITVTIQHTLHKFIMTNVKILITQHVDVHLTYCMTLF